MRTAEDTRVLMQLHDELRGKKMVSGPPSDDRQQVARQKASQGKAMLKIPRERRWKYRTIPLNDMTDGKQ